MRRLMLLAAALLFCAAYPITTFAQETLRDLIPNDEADKPEDSVPPQRIGVPPGQMHLSSNETGSVQGYCFDEYLIAPRRLMSFRHILAGKNDAVVQLGDGSTVPLDEAVQKGAVGIKALQLGVRFTNRTGEPITIELRHPVVLWDRAGGDINPMALGMLETSGMDYDDRQEAIWRVTTAERTLAVLGYYDGSIFNIDRDRFRAAAGQFQKDHGLVPNGEFDQNTVARLASTHNDMQQRLNTMGFGDHDGNSLREDLAAQIRSYQRYLGAAATGRWSPQLENRYAMNQRLYTELGSLRPAGKEMQEVLAGNNYPDVLTYLEGMKGFMALVETPEGVELWTRRGSEMRFVGRGNEAVKSMDDAAAALAMRASRSNRVVIYPRVSPNGTSSVLIGERSVQVDSKSMAEYLRGGAMPGVLADAVADLASGGSDPRGSRPGSTVVLYRGPFVQGRHGAAPAGYLGAAGMEQADGGQLAKALDRSFGDRMAIYTSDDLRVGATRIPSTSNGQGMFERPTPGTRPAGGAGLTR
ncbi:MAG: peptidoglycan-binding protein [Bacteroidetes bacterium]|nr:peptidoglycan-binding protein [Bacteroidota bacterium]